jgi:hypothetical protein
MTNTQTVHIRVRGRLSRRLATAFEGMTLVAAGGATELVGEVVDQAQLHGLLTRIRDLALDLEAITVSPADPATKKEA